MTKLELEIKASITYVGQTDEDMNDDARSIAEIATRYIKQAYEAGFQDGNSGQESEDIGLEKHLKGIE